MISTKGYFYFDHINPKHNIRARKSLKKQINSITQEQIEQPFKEKDKSRPGKEEKGTELLGIVGKSYDQRFNQQNSCNVYGRYARSRGGSDYRLTFEKLQHILSNTSVEWKAPKNNAQSSAQMNPESRQFQKKNSMGSDIHCGKYVKTPKNKELKDCLFKSESHSRPRTMLATRTKNNSSAMTQPHHPAGPSSNKEQSLIYPSMNGVFIPSAKFKYNRSKSIRRYNTSYNN